jgi:hypothetical protein
MRQETHMTQKLSEAYLADDFLERVKRSYRLAIEKFSGSDGDIWPQIDAMRRPVHDALMASKNDGLASAEHQSTKRLCQWWLTEEHALARRSLLSSRAPMNPLTCIALYVDDD